MKHQQEPVQSIVLSGDKEHPDGDRLDIAETTLRGRSGQVLEPQAFSKRLGIIQPLSTYPTSVLSCTSAGVLQTDYCFCAGDSWAVTYEYAQGPLLASKARNTSFSQQTVVTKDLPLGQQYRS